MWRLFSLVLFIMFVIAELFPVNIHNITLFLFVIWIVTSYIAFPTVFKQSITQKRYLFLFAFLVFYFLSTSLGRGFFQGFVFTLFMMRVVSPILMYDILRSCNKKTQKIFVASLILVFVYYASWMYQLIDRYGAELGIKNSIIQDDNEDYVDTAFAYVYSLPILVVALIINVRSIIKQRKKQVTTIGRMKIIAGLLLIAYFSVLVFKSLFMTAIVLLIIGVCLGFFYNKNGNKWIVRSSIAILLLAFVFITQYDNISKTVETLGSQSTDQRVKELYLTLTGKNDQAKDITARQNLTNISITTFLHHPIMGTNHLLGGKRYADNIVGNHAEWFDLLALYGIFAFLLFYIVYTSLRKQYYDTKEFIPSIIYVLMGFLNPMFYFVVNLTMFVIVPLLNSFNPQEETV